MILFLLFKDDSFWFTYVDSFISFICRDIFTVLIRKNENFNWFYCFYFFFIQSIWWFIGFYTMQIFTASIYWKYKIKFREMNKIRDSSIFLFSLKRNSAFNFEESRKTSLWHQSGLGWFQVYENKYIHLLKYMWSFPILWLVEGLSFKHKIFENY